jgi:hypothetical protein
LQTWEQVLKTPPLARGIFMSSSPEEVDVDSIVAEYSIDVESTRSIEVRGLEATTKLFIVERPDLIEKLYIIDTAQGKRIACHPHIVGKKLKNLAFGAALEAAKAMSQLTDIAKVDRDSTVVENVLRAAPGYELHEAFKELTKGRGFRDVWILPRYGTPSYRSHDKESQTELNIIYEDFEALPRNREITVLKPDTEATGKTGKKSIERIVEKCEDAGSTMKEIILYGFISAPGLEMISETANRHGIELTAFAIGNVTDLAHNGYDMTLYGVDESFWKATGKTRKLGSIVDVTTLERYLPEFVPGSDQPGDWSDRQTSVYATNERKEPGEIGKHLRNSVRLIESLVKISDYTPWQERIVNNELKLLHAALQKDFIDSCSSPT